MFSTHKTNISRLGLLLVLALLAPAAGAVTPGQMDNFETVGTQGWSHGGSPNPPTNVAAQMGDPAFLGSNYLRNTSTANDFAGGKLVVWNRTQWKGDYISAGIIAIRAHVKVDPSSESDLSLRVGFQHVTQNTSIGIVSVTPVVVPKDGNWYQVTLPIAASDLVQSTGNFLPVDHTMRNVGQFRIFSNSADNNFSGEQMVATMWIDNIEAVAPIHACNGSVLCSLPDINQNGFADIAVVMPGGSNHVHIRDGNTGALINDINFGDDPVNGIGVIADIGGNNLPEIALLGTRPDNNVRVQVKDSGTGGTVNNIFYGSAYSAVDMTILPDTNFNGAAEFAVIGAAAGGGVRVQARDALTDANTSTTYYGVKAPPLGVLSIPDIIGNTKPELIMHGTVTASGLDRAQMRDSVRAGVIRNIFFGNVYSPIGLSVIGDVSGDGIPDLAHVGQRSDTSAVRMQVKSTSAGALLFNAFTGSTDNPIAAVGIGHANGDSVPDVALLVERPDGTGKVVIRDGATGAHIRNIFFGKVSNPVAMVLLEDLDASGTPELAVLGDDGAAAKRVQIRDSISGAQINTIDLPLPTVTYRITFDALWTVADFPTNFPGNAHFSRLVGTAHNQQVKFWEVGGDPATAGIESMAETGSTTAISNEITAAQNNLDSLGVFLGSGIGSGDGDTNFEFDVNANFPFITFVSMVAPSPDWFVGISGFSLLDGNGNWKINEVIPLAVYDSGTDLGTQPTSPNQDNSADNLPITVLSSDRADTDFESGVHFQSFKVIGNFIIDRVDP